MSITQNIPPGRVDSIEESWIKAAQKDLSAFEKLYDKHYEAIFRYVHQRMDSKDDACDVTQQVFIKAMTNIKKYKFMGYKFSSWLYRIAKSETFQFLKDKSKSPTLNVETNSLNQLAEKVDTETRIENEVLIAVLQELNETELELVEMRFFEQRSFKEMGEILNMTENNVKVKTHRVIKKLKR
ncbi:MAG: sigma-70 family RNA polymerase sigma factor [Flavobacteriales bacterium]